MVTPLLWCCRTLPDPESPACGDRLLAIPIRCQFRLAGTGLSQRFDSALYFLKSLFDGRDFCFCFFQLCGIPDRPFLRQGRIPGLLDRPVQPFLFCILLLLIHCLIGGLQLLIFAAAFLQILEGPLYVGRCKIFRIAAVIHGSAVRLLIELEQSPPQSGFSAAELPHQAKGLPLVNL